MSFCGLGAEFGALMRPAHKRYRAGVAVRTPLDSKPTTEAMVDVLDGRMRTAQGSSGASHRVHVPWEIDAGFACQFGERRTNVPWRNTTGIRQNLQTPARNRHLSAAASLRRPRLPALPEDPKAASGRRSPTIAKRSDA